MTLKSKPPRPKTCKNPACAEKFTPQRMGQAVCSPKCGLAIKDVHKERAARAIKQRERQESKEVRQRIKSRADYTKEAQAAFNEWVRERDANLPCISCGRHHQGKYDAGHYRSVGGNPALRFEPLNCHKQCVPCNQHKSGNIVEYRLCLVARIGAEAVEWLEGPHEPKRYAIEELQQIKAEYKAKTRALRLAAQ